MFFLRSSLSSTRSSTYSALSVTLLVWLCCVARGAADSFSESHPYLARIGSDHGMRGVRRVNMLAGETRMKQIRRGWELASLVKRDSVEEVLGTDEERRPISIEDEDESYPVEKIEEWIGGDDEGVHRVTIISNPHLGSSSTPFAAATTATRLSPSDSLPIVSTSTADVTTTTIHNFGLFFSTIVVTTTASPTPSPSPVSPTSYLLAADLPPATTVVIQSLSDSSAVTSDALLSPTTTLSDHLAASPSHSTSLTSSSTSESLDSAASGGSTSQTVGSSSSNPQPSITAGASRSSTSPVSAFVMPGQTLSVLPVGLGIFGGVTILALIIVGLVTWERKKYRSQFRARRQADQMRAAQDYTAYDVRSEMEEVGGGGFRR